MDIHIDLVRREGDARVVADLAREFIDWMRERYPEMQQEIDTYLRQQKFDEQLDRLLTFYTPPAGECLLARCDGEPAGILMLKDIGNGVCEMNRMYVRDAARGRGVGRALVEKLCDRAREMGFSTMVLSALPRHHEAMPLYRSMGFVEDDSYREPGNTDVAIVMRRDLGG